MSIIFENVKMYMGKIRVKTDQAKIGLLYRAKWTLLGCTLDILPGIVESGKFSARNTVSAYPDCC